MSTHIILHVGANEVPTKKAPEQIAESTVNLTIKLKRNCDVSISDITARNDQYQKKAVDVNRELKDKCCEKKLQFLDHSGTATVRHLNASKLHLIRLLKLSLILQIDSMSYIAWLVITEKIVIPTTMMKIKLS